MTEDGYMDWDDVIEDDGQEFIVLPEGDYDFTVTNFERGRFAGGGNVITKPCNKATLTLQVKTDKGTATVKTDLILHESMLWKVSSFFRSIGMKKHGERVQMKWNEVTGKRGRAHFIIREWTGRDGTLKQSNDVDKFYDYDPANFGKVRTSMEDDFMNIPAEPMPDELTFE